MRPVLAVALLVLALACSGGSSAGDTTDAAPDQSLSDTGPTDTPPADLPPADLPPADLPPEEAGPDVIADLAAPDTTEAVAPDADAPDVPSVPLAGFGSLSGECGVLDDAVWASSEPRFFVTHLDFAGDGYDDIDHDLLTTGGQKIMDDPNAGGSSKPSEAFAFEVLARCELADLLKTELEVDYLDEQGKITDLLVRVDGLKLGVSVTRAMSWPYDAAYPQDTASDLLTKKLEGIQASTANVAPNDAWVRQALSVLAFSDAHAVVLREAWNALPADLRGDTLLFVTVSDGDDAFLY